MATEVLSGLYVFRQTLKHKLFIAVPIALVAVVGIEFEFGVIAAVESAAGFAIIASILWEVVCSLGLRKMRQKTGLTPRVLHYMLIRNLINSHWRVPPLKGPNDPVGNHEKQS